MKKRGLSILLSLCIVMSMFTFIPLSVSAATSGTCGNDVIWELDTNTGVLTISGTGDIKNVRYKNVPWYSLRLYVTSVIINEGVESVGSCAFYNCSNLKTVVLPDSLKSINNESFYNCSSLEEIVIPCSVNVIEREAFYNCNNLKIIEIGKNLSNIEYNAFKNCNKLMDVYITDLTTWCNISFNGEYASPLRYAENLYVNGTLLEELVIPENLKSIKDYTFYGCANITTITIPEGVTDIGDYAFSNCYNCERVNIPKSLETIGLKAFYNCENLQGVNITDLAAWCNIDFTGNDASPLYYGENLYLNGDLLTKLNIPDEVQCIGDYAFYNAVNISSISIPDSVRYIGAYAFYNTEYYNNANNWEGNILYINNHFIKGKNIEVETFVVKNGTLTVAGASLNSSDLSKVIIPDSVLSIGSNAFTDCVNLTEVILGINVEHIGEAAFYICSALKKINIPYSVKTIGGRAFYGCESLTSIEIPDSVINIGIYTFEDCINLTDVKLSNNISVIEQGLFEGCKNLLNVIIPEKVVKIGLFAFSGCSSLTNIKIPDKVEKIPNETFAGCSNLKKVKLSKNLNLIDYRAFAGCENLISIEMFNSLKEISDDAFEGCNSIAEVYYEGDETDWLNIDFTYGNDCITNAIIYYNWVDDTQTSTDIYVEYFIEEDLIRIIPKNVEEGSIIAVSVITNGVTVVDAIKYSPADDVTFKINEDRMKIFVWESFESMKPICNAIVVE